MAEVLIYATAASHDQALAIGRAIVDERLGACVNILGAMTSVYRWENAVREDAEVAFLIKTRVDLVDALCERIRALHEYACPCVVAVPICGGNPAFLAWIKDECRRSDPEAAG